MSMDNGNHKEASGPIAYMAGNSVAANLLMWAIVAAGLVSLTGLDREAWPTTPFYHIEVSMAYPGATPEEIEESIVVKIEDQVSGLDDVKAVKSVAAPGIASVRVQMDSGTDMAQALNDIESAVNRIQSFPAGADRPSFREMDNRMSLMRLIVYGDVSERSLKELAYQIEDELAALPSVSQVDVSGVRKYEISVEVPLHRLGALGLTLTDVAGTIRRSSLNLSAGSIDTRESQVRIRTLGQNYDQQDFEDIVLLSRSDGTVVRLGDIAEVHDGFQESDLIVRHQNHPAVFVEVFRADGEQVMDVATTVRDHLENEVIPALPDGVAVTMWNDESQVYEERADLLIKNGILGLLLVLIALSLFLQIRLAVWVAVGLAVSGIGALAVMNAFGVSINEISLFSFVLAIGIVVDDAIVVAEHIQYERSRGTPGVTAAIRGVRRIKVPLTFAVLTSVVAFVPLLFIPGGIGDVWRALPVIIIAMLLVSLVESLLVLPNHLSHLKGPDWVPVNAFERFFTRIQGRVDGLLNRFVQGPLDRALRFATDQPAITMGGAVGMLVLSISLLPAGIVPTTLAADIEGDFATVVLEMPDGTTAPRTYEVARELEAAGHRVMERLSSGRPEDAPPLLSGVTVTVGMGSRREGGLNPTPTLNPQANIATIEFKLLSAQQRQISSGEVVQAWREEVGVLPYVRGLTFSGAVFDLGNPVEALLSHPDPEILARIANAVVDGLREVAGVHDIRSDHTPGIPEMQLELRPEARTLDLTLEALAGQTRAAFFGADAVRVQRGREEVRVYVRLPADARSSITDIERYLVRTPGGAEVPVVSVATLKPGVSPPSVRRKDGQRVVTVSADVDAAVISGDQANSILEGSILAALTAVYPDLTYTFGGEQQQQLDSLDALYRGFAIALIMIFALLAIPLRSYTKPFIIMAVIPFGFIGVILGHWVLGVALSAVSFLGIFGLSGVVVNDSLVMIDFIDQKLKEGNPVQTAIIEGAKGRFRPIMLTSLTTFLGFTPLILETAIQAQFLIPFAASLGCGIIFVTAILMMIVPALSTIHLRLMTGGQI
ncbi:MAG: efflux RND transporter permease subunit [Gemmatimonadetes bacterium]|nr:efflux RND transporter permease subunit [Gemmatimonadota bacterium]MYG86811.1 efflux RND transporter permease subunit [Gemmatimonadota bacterium]MYJ88422.1 efflux RND transporter permease subunit [Gemmatimonadota bacterium]